MDYDDSGNSKSIKTLNRLSRLSSGPIDWLVGKAAALGGAACRSPVVFKPITLYLPGIPMSL